MAQLLLYILLALCLLVFIRELMELHNKNKEFDISLGSEDIKQYIEKTFGKGNYRIFKTTTDEDGKISHTIYLPKYEWFKTPEYKWYDVYATNTGYHHEQIEE